MRGKLWREVMIRMRETQAEKREGLRSRPDKALFLPTLSGKRERKGKGTQASGLQELGAERREMRPCGRLTRTSEQFTNSYQHSPCSLSIGRDLGNTQ